MNALAIWLAAASVLCLLAFIYPYVVYPILLRLLPKVSEPDPASLQHPDELEVALLFCAYNEEAALPAKLENLKNMKAEMPRLKIYAYSDCSSDKTNALLEEAAHFLTPVIGQERLGKALGMQKLVDMAEADVLVFTDANVHVTLGSLTRLVNYFADPNIGAVAATLLYDQEENPASTTSATAQVGGLYWRLEEHIKKLESASGSMMGADGAFFARRRAGYPMIRPDLVDDMAVSMDVVCKGMRCVSAPDVIGMEASVTSRSEEFKRKRRIACGSYSTYRFMKSRLRRLSLLDQFKFYSHKVMRWWGAYFLAAALIFTVAAAFAAGVGGITLLTLGVLGVAFVTLSKGQRSPLAPLYEVLLAVIATGIGVWESISGSSYATWDPATTR